MNKKDYVLLHTLLAKLKYELEMELLKAIEKYAIEMKENIKAIDEIMKIFIVECD